VMMRERDEDEMREPRGAYLQTAAPNFSAPKFLSQKALLEPERYLEFLNESNHYFWYGSSS
jgi:hypothetical protein